MADTGAAPTAIRKEFEAWRDSGVQTAYLDIKKVNTKDFQILLEFDDNHKCTITYPDEFPKVKDRFFVWSDDSNLEGKWLDQVSAYCEKDGLTLTQIFTEMASAYMKHVESAGGDGDGADDGGDTYDDTAGADGYDEDFGFVKEEPKTVKKQFDKVDEMFAQKKFVDTGSPAATLRLIQDLKTIVRADSSKLGFSAAPSIDRARNLENLYQWEVKLFGFDGQLGEDMKRYKKETGKDHILIHMRFSKEYPQLPPFVRVIEPRFQFHTGNITLGGAICMELLTRTGWRPINEVESIMIQIRSQVAETGRIQFGHDEHSGTGYNENEAWQAFYRAASNHGWDVTGFGPQMFPSI